MTHKKLAVESRAKGVRLTGDPTLVARSKAQKLDDIWPRSAQRLFERLRSHQLGVKLSNLAKDRYERWMVRCLVKARLIRTVAAVTRLKAANIKTQRLNETGAANTLAKSA